MTYALTTIWYERKRFFPAVMAVAFSDLLIALQSGLLIGLLSMMSMPVDRSLANVWVGHPGVRSVDLGRGFPDRWRSRLIAQPECVKVEPCLLGFSLWTRYDRATDSTTNEACTVVGSRLYPEALGVVEPLRKRPELLAALAEPCTVVVDESELGRLGIRGTGATAEVFGTRVRVVGLVRECKSLGGPYIFCSIETARLLLRMVEEESTYQIAWCRTPEDAKRVVERLRNFPNMDSFTADEFSFRSRMHWLTTTKAGIALGFTALLGLLVGAVVTSQTLYAATAASQREFATLRAMGIPRWRMKLLVLEQSAWVGLAGILLATPITFLLAAAANTLGTTVRLSGLILGGAAIITMTMAFLAGLSALRSFQGVDPAHNIR